MAVSRRTLIGAILLPAATQAQPPGLPVLHEVSYPRLPGHAVDAAGFVPSGWRLEESATGDLNEDGLPDLAMVLRASDPANILDNPGLGERRFDTNPRILAFAFNTPDGYRLILQD